MLPTKVNKMVNGYPSHKYQVVWKQTKYVVVAYIPVLSYFCAKIQNELGECCDASRFYSIFSSESSF